jgi:hypothetical protein
MTGTIFQIWGKGTNCLIRDSYSRKIYWSHIEDFEEPSKMKLGAKVQYRLKLARGTGKYPPVTDVIAA